MRALMAVPLAPTARRAEREPANRSTTPVSISRCAAVRRLGRPRSRGRRAPFPRGHRASRLRWHRPGRRSVSVGAEAPPPGPSAEDETPPGVRGCGPGSGVVFGEEAATNGVHLREPRVVCSVPIFRDRRPLLVLDQAKGGLRVGLGAGPRDAHPHPVEQALMTTSRLADDARPLTPAETQKGREERLSLPRRDQHAVWFTRGKSRSRKGGADAPAQLSHSGSVRVVGFTRQQVMAKAVQQALREGRCRRTRQSGSTRRETRNRRSAPTPRLGRTSSRRVP